jgi:hypothetical protein
MRDEYDDVLAFLVDRLTRADHTWVGASSNAMVKQALLGTAYPDMLPMDRWDLARCEETYRRAPAVLQAKMLPTLELGRRAIREGGLHCRGCDTFGHSGTWRHLCSACREAQPA